MVINLIAVLALLFCMASTSVPERKQRFLDKPGTSWTHKTACCHCDDSDPTSSCRNINCRYHQELCPNFCMTAIHVTFEGRVVTKRSCGTEAECVQGYYDTKDRKECRRGIDKHGHFGLRCTFCCRSPSLFKPTYCLEDDEHRYFDFTGYILPTTQTMPVKSTSTTLAKSTSPMTVMSTIHSSSVTKPAQCYTCAGPGCKEAIEECPSQEPLCMNTVLLDNGKITLLKKSCVSYGECYRDAYLQQNQYSVCRLCGASSPTTRPTACLYCCNSSIAGAPCNADLIPSNQLQYTEPPAKREYD